MARWDLRQARDKSRAVWQPIPRPHDAGTGASAATPGEDVTWSSPFNLFGLIKFYG